MMITDWQNKRVIVMGLGRFGGGVGVTRWLVRQGARVTVTDLASEEKLAGSLAQLEGLGVELRLGRHEEADFRDADAIVVNPAVPERAEHLQIARAAGVPITTEINLFVERCPAKTIGVTGSVGKSTVTAMIGHVLEEGTKARRHEGTEGERDIGTEGRRDGGERADASSRSHVPTFPRSHIFVGGNIGCSLLDDLPDMTTADVVVLELSSFQLERTPLVRWSPDIAVITNVTPNHLDWHGSFEAYRDAKLNVVRFQDARRGAVVVAEPELLPLVRAHTPHGRVWCGELDGSTPAAHCSEQRVRWDGTQLTVPGRHNLHNAAVALTVAHLGGVGADEAIAALTTFEALPHRLQKVHEAAGVTYYDDSKSTTPEAALTALRAIDAPTLLILGGYDKGSDFTPLAAEVARRTRFCACVGTTGEKIVDAVRAAGGSAEHVGELAAAVAACQRRAAAGDVILLSPACASWDQFVDYRARGEQFARLARGERSTG